MVWNAKKCVCGCGGSKEKCVCGVGGWAGGRGSPALGSGMRDWTRGGEKEEKKGKKNPHQKLPS